MWYRVENLQNTQALIDDYEKLHGNSLSVNNTPKKPRGRPQKNSIPAEQPINRPAKHHKKSLKAIQQHHFLVNIIGKTRNLNLISSLSSYQILTCDTAILRGWSG